MKGAWPYNQTERFSLSFLAKLHRCVHYCEDSTGTINTITRTDRSVGQELPSNLLCKYLLLLNYKGG